MGADTDAQWDEASALLAGQNRQTRSSADHKKLLVGGPLSDLLMPYRLMAIKPAILIPTKIPVLVFCRKLILRLNAWESKSFPGFVISGGWRDRPGQCFLWAIPAVVVALRGEVQFLFAFHPIAQSSTASVGQGQGQG